MANGWFTVAAAVLSVLVSFLLRRYFMNRDERKKAFKQYWIAFEHLMDRLRSLQRVINATPNRQKVPAEARQRALDAEREWRDAARNVQEAGNRAVISALDGHIQDTEQKIKAAHIGEWPHDDGSSDRRLHSAMRRHYPRRRRRSLP